MQKVREISKKICMLGSFGAGKTSLVRRFVYNKFEEKYLSTIGVQLSQKSVTVSGEGLVHGEERLKLILWDLAHIEKFDKVIKNYFRGSHGAIVVLDLTRRQTFDEMDVFLKPFAEMNPASKIVFIGNKSDLVKPTEEDRERFLQLSESYKTFYTFTSAKTGENVEQMFLKLSALLIKAD